MPVPLLYSFRRCPYAIRARMALFSAGIELNIREVSLKNKPQAMLDISSKGTVPVLVVDDKVIDESLDIMLWALGTNDPEGWLSHYDEADKARAMQLIGHNDEEFKGWLDKYKYADRHPKHPQEFYRNQCTDFLQTLESALQNNQFLMGSTMTLADIAIFPFIRQFAMVDKNWFDQCAYPALKDWLNRFLALPLFTRVMAKSPVGQAQ